MKKNRHEKGTALVTGASSGIGLELVKVLARNGHDVVITARKADALEALAGSVEGRYGIKATVIPVDLAHRDAPQRLADTILAQKIDVDILVNNAGFGLGGQFSDTDIERELEMIELNVTALTHLTKLFLGPMLARRSGHIMNVASTASFQAGPLMSVYYATKAYVLSFSEALAEELRGTGVTMTTFCPGPTATNFADAAGITNSGLFVMRGVAAADATAEYGYKAMMAGRRVVVPGVKNKLLAQGNRIVPRALATRIARYVQENR